MNQTHINIHKDALGREHGVFISFSNEIVMFQDTIDGKSFGKPSQFMIPKDQLEKKVHHVLNTKIRRLTLQQQGYLFEIKDRKTRCVRLIRLAEDKDSGKYEVICDDHGFLIGVETLHIAKTCSTLDFCGKCQGHED